MNFAVLIDRGKESDETVKERYERIYKKKPRYERNKAE